VDQIQDVLLRIGPSRFSVMLKKKEE